ncbi:MAG: 2-amino-4-hydroxy-6-hydroxymethyldihydropteridine diphosphokinase [Deltaproteobacteria bacterium]|nr:MAG: 2-amino-4-hydroxy-6-hydroxymethyldihydropteridine diphosphokinase [Deltaproteobacteria bacterium]
MAETVYIGLGGNLGDPAAAVRAAFARMRAWRFAGDAALSPLYRTAPVGPVRDQPAFINAVARIAVDGIQPEALLMRLQRLEHAFGRRRDRPQGPRTLDLDLLLFGDRRIRSPSLVVPHPRMTERAFVLRPLADVAGPDLIVEGRPIAAWLADVRDQLYTRCSA